MTMMIKISQKLLLDSLYFPCFSFDHVFFFLRDMPSIFAHFKCLWSVISALLCPATHVLLLQFFHFYFLCMVVCHNLWLKKESSMCYD
jgi:hypothetical protein